MGEPRASASMISAARGKRLKCLFGSPLEACELVCQECFASCVLVIFRFLVVGGAQRCVLSNVLDNLAASTSAIPCPAGRRQWAMS